MYLKLDLILCRYFEGDEELPIYSEEAISYSAEEILRIILHVPSHMICLKQPTSCFKSSTFIVDLSKLDHREG